MKGKLTDQISIQNINIVLFCIIRLDIVNNHIESKKVQCPFLQLLMIINKFCLGDFDHRKSTWSSVKIFQKFHRLFGFFSKLNLSRALTASLTISWKVWCEHWRHKTNKHIHLESFQVRQNFVNIKDRMKHIGSRLQSEGLTTMLKLIMHRQEKLMKWFSLHVYS